MSTASVPFHWHALALPMTFFFVHIVYSEDEWKKFNTPNNEYRYSWRFTGQWLMISYCAYATKWLQSNFVWHCIVVATSVQQTDSVTMKFLPPYGTRQSISVTRNVDRRMRKPICWVPYRSLQHNIISEVEYATTTRSSFKSCSPNTRAVSTSAKGEPRWELASPLHLEVLLTISMWLWSNFTLMGIVSSSSN